MGHAHGRRRNQGRLGASRTAPLAARRQRQIAVALEIWRRHATDYEQIQHQPSEQQDCHDPGMTQRPSAIGSNHPFILIASIRVLQRPIGPTGLRIRCVDDRRQRPAPNGRPSCCSNRPSRPLRYTDPNRTEAAADHRYRRHQRARPRAEQVRRSRQAPRSRRSSSARTRWSSASSSPCSAAATSSSKACPASPRRSRQHPRPRHRRPVRAHPVHPRPPPRRRHRHDDLQPAGRPVHVRKGPIFANIVLADEVNRAPAKVQSALLEAMQERQVTIGGTHLPARRSVHGARDAEPHRARGHVSASRGAARPLHAQGPRHLPHARRGEAHPGPLRRARTPHRRSRRSPTPDDHRRRRPRPRRRATWTSGCATTSSTSSSPRESRSLPDAAASKPLIEYGASPRASIFLAQAARAHAFVNGRGHVEPDDVKAMAMDVLRHRMVETYEAEAENVTREDIVSRVLAGVEVP